MSRTAEIPENFMIKWQSNKNRGTKAARRPMTACQTCRASKVKCDGKQRCSHCTARGVACVYTNSKSTKAGTNGVVPKSSQQVYRPTETNDRYLVPWPAPPATPMNSDQIAYRDVYSPGSPAPRMTTGLNEMESVAAYDAQVSGLGMQLDLSGSIDMRSPAVIPEYHADSIYPIHPSTDTDTNGSLRITSPGSSGASSKSDSGGVSFAASCICRDKLSKSVSDINSAMAGNTTSDIFQLTSEFMRTCRGVMDCNFCTLECTDLVCLVSLFQQTGSCFHYIAATDPKHQSIRLRFADTLVPVTDPRMRLMAVTNLVQHAIDILDAIGNRGQFMLQASSPPTTLALANTGYLENTISEFKKTLGDVIAIAEHSANQAT